MDIFVQTKSLRDNSPVSERLIDSHNIRLFNLLIGTCLTNPVSPCSSRCLIDCIKRLISSLDKYLSNTFSELSRTHVVKLIDEGNVFVNDKAAKGSLKLKENDVIEIEIPEVKELEIDKEDIPLDIVYEDKDILIINKPQGMVVHPSNGHNEHTLVNAILFHCHDLSGINGVSRPGIVHRIDKDTSGLICVAKNDAAHMALADQLKDHTMSRTYIALVRGVILENTGEINLPIGRDPNNRQKMGVTRTNSKEAITYFKVLKRYKEHTLVECHLKTGRTHQISLSAG